MGLVIILGQGLRDVAGLRPTNHHKAYGIGHVDRIHHRLNDSVASLNICTSSDTEEDLISIDAAPGSVFVDPRYGKSDVRGLQGYDRAMNLHRRTPPTRARTLPPTYQGW